MLCVNVTQRIPMRNRKEHPVFRPGLPERYIVPLPLPLPHLLEPVSPDEIGDRVRQVLTSIGYESNEDIGHELTITGHTAAKVFFRMLWQLQKWDELPWNDDQGANEGLDEAFLLSPRLIAQRDADLSDPLNRQKAEIGSLGNDPVRSLAQRPDWVPLDLAARPDEYVHELRQIDLTLPALMAELQDLMTQNGFQWFHPNDARLIVRAPQTRVIATIDVENQSQDWLCLGVVRRMGQANDFDRLLAMITERIGPFAVNVGGLS
jgi:hypothetical protein